ncbi:MAG: peptidoglycan binding domain-containing protein, partial [Patescibacteria group bacterium]
MRQVRWLVHRVLLWGKGHKRAVRYGLYGIAACIVATVVLQLVYPAGRILPFVEVQNRGLGGRSTADAAKQLDKDFARAKLSLKTEDKTFTTSLEEIGIEVESTATARAAAKYTLAQRLIPFSSLAIMLERDTPTNMRFDDERLRYFAEQINKEGFVAAVNAAIAVKGSKVELVPAKPSKEYPTATIERALRSTHFSPRTEVRVSPRTKAAERTNEEVKGVLHDAQRAVDTSLKLKLNDEEVTVDKAVIGSWLDFPEDAQTMRLQLSLNAASVKKYLESIQSKVYKAPGTTRVQLIDGREVSRTAGEVGRGIDTDKTIASLTDAVKKGEDI